MGVAECGWGAGEERQGPIFRALYAPKSASFFSGLLECSPQVPT